MKKKSIFLNGGGLNRLSEFGAHFTLGAGFEKVKNVIPCLLCFPLSLGLFELQVRPVWQMFIQSRSACYPGSNE